VTRTNARPTSAERRSARAAAAAPRGEDGAFTHRQIVTVIVGLMVGMFLAALDQTVVSTAIRVIADDLQGYDLQAWATTAFLITSTISTPLYGKLSDMYGRRPFYLFAIAVFVLGSALCGLAWSMYSLAAFRAIQGIGAGGLMSLALAIIGDLVPPRQRAKYQGYFMAVFGTSSVLGPVVGGFLAGQSSLLGVTGWRWIFFINVPLGFLAFAVVSRVLHLPHERREHRIDWPGALALITALVPLLIVAEQGRTWGWTSPAALACYGIGLAGLAAFLQAERSYGDNALLPLRLFGNRSFTVAGMGSIVMGAGMFGGLLLLPQYLQIVQGSSPTVAGLQMIPLVAGIMAGAMGSGIGIARTGRYKIFPLTGVVLMVVALVALSMVVDADASVWSLVPFMVLMGLGLGLNMQPVILAVQNAVSPREMGVATSSVTFFRQMGGSIGTAGHALALPFKVGFSNTLDLVFLVAAVVVALGFVVLWFLPELPLRTQSGIAARQDEARQADAGLPPQDDEVAQANAAVGISAPTSTPPPAGRPGDVPG
jgi:EmrB/QacA subfamily drug resistance transporter